MPRRGTYSIVARDADTGELGVAVQSHWFTVGSIVSWAQPGIGAVATQSVAEPAYGPDCLAALAKGATAREALEAQLALDELAPYRQVAVVDDAGRVHVHTGADCIPYAGHLVGDGFSCQANMMAKPGVPEAMAKAFGGASGDLAARLMAALEGAEEAGGDVRGRQSAAIVVVEATGEPWRKRIDLRIEDHHDPITEMARLLTLQRAYDLADQGDECAGAGDHEQAGALYRRAAELAPESDELLFWGGLAQYAAGDEEAGLDAVRRAIAINSAWPVLLERLAPELAPAAAAVLAALQG